MTEGNISRGDGSLTPILVKADNLAEGVHKAIIACHDYGARVETPKHKPGMSLGYDAPIVVSVKNAAAQPQVYFPAMHDTPIGTMQYILEVTHGIHNHWKKSKEEPHFWGYTYNERFVDQLPFVFQRIKADWDDKKIKEGIGRISGRDYQFDIWRAGEDIVLSQPDAPCFQRGSLRFVQNEKGEWVMNYNTTWRSRDLLKAWNQNNLGQVGSPAAPGLMHLFRDKIQSMLGVPIQLGTYNDYAESLHLYGLYVDRDGLEHQIEQMKAVPYQEKSMALDDYLLANMEGADIPGLKRIIAAQSDAEKKGHGKNQPLQTLRNLGYDLDNFQYPSDWDRWPDSWDVEPNPELLARVLDTSRIRMGMDLMQQICERGIATPGDLVRLNAFRGSLKVMERGI